MHSRQSEPRRPLDWWEVLLEEHVELDEHITDKAGALAAIKSEIEEQISSQPRHKQADVALANVHERIHNSPQERRALCLSGGGIRSATFNLGLLQGLAKEGQLTQFDYLSTVSGGGYIGSWLSAWVHRAGNIEAVQQKLVKEKRPKPVADKYNETANRKTASTPVEGVEPEEVSYLREYSNYLTPRLGWLSADTWMLGATYLRNLLLNWAVLLPLMLSLIAFIWAGYFALCGLAAWLDGQPPLGPKDWRLLEQPYATLVSWFQLILLVAGIGAAIPLLPNFAAVRDSNRDRKRNPIPMAAHDRAGRLRPVWFVVLPVLLSACLLPASSYAWGKGQRAGFSFVAMIPTLLVTWAVLSLLITLVTGVVMKTQTARWLKKPWPAFFDWCKIYGLYFLACAISSIAGFVVMSYLFPLKTQDPLLFFWLLPPVRLMQVYLFFTVIVGGLSEVNGPDMEENREWWARLMGLLLLATVGYLAVVGLLLVGPYLLFFSASDGWFAAPTLGSTLLGGVGAVWAGKSTFTGAISNVAKSRTQVLLQMLPSLLAGLFLASVLLLGSGFVMWALIQFGYGGSATLALYPIFSPTVSPLHPVLNLQFALMLGGGTLLLGILLAWPINVNRFSLHNIYRMRLVRAYLGASRGEEREAEAFTGFDGADNLPMHFLCRPRHFSFADLGFIRPSEASSEKLLEWLVQSADDVAARVRQTPSLRDPAKWKALQDRLNQMGTPGVDKIVLDAFNEALDDPAILEAGNHFQLPAICRAAEQVQSAGQIYFVNRLIIEHAVRLYCDKPMAGARAAKPFHVINTALNLVAGKRLAWQQRKARSFTFTPLQCGFDLGYRPTSLYADGISAGGAMTISGAAASPNMGYHSSSLVTALMTLFNVRLGAWYGNPAVPAYEPPVDTAPLSALAAKSRLAFGPIPPKPPYRLPSPRFSFQPLLDEVFGRTTEDSEYVYLSDGGHFENLGLYEMVRRRCRVIIVSDASCDPDGRLADLGNAIRKIRIDLGIHIELESRPGRKRNKDTGCCTFGRVCYRDVDGANAPDGWLLYIKPIFKGADPVDVYHYSRENKKFPHETTADQWFSEAQFESYRRLGEMAARDVEKWLSTDPPEWIKERFRSVRQNAKQAENARADAGGEEPQGGRWKQQPAAEKPKAKGSAFYPIPRHLGRRIPIIKPSPPEDDPPRP